MINVSSIPSTVFNVRQSKEFQHATLGAILTELIKRKDEHTWTYRPMPKQEIFHKSKAKIKMYLGGNRAGKTTAGLTEDIWRALGEHPYQDVPVPSRGWIVGLDRTNMLETILIPKFFKLLPERYIKHWDKKNSILKLTNGSEIVFKTADSGKDKFQSDDVDWIHFDEEPPEEIWKESLWRTIDRCGKTYLTMTPTNGISWSYDQIYQNQGSDIEVIEVSTLDNIHLPQEEVQKLAVNSTEEERQMRLSGKYVSMGMKKCFPFDLLEKLRPEIKDPIARGEIVSGNFVEDKEGCFQVWEQPEAGRLYIVGVDCSEGMKDPTCVSVWKYDGTNRFVQVAEYEKVLDPEAIDRKVKTIADIYNKGFLIIERNSAGISVITRLINVYDNLYLRTTNNDSFNQGFTTTVGWHTDMKTKYKMVVDLRDWLSGNMIIRSDKLWRQLENFVEVPQGTGRIKYRAQTGHDDLVIGAMLALQGLLSGQAELSAFTPVDELNLEEKNDGFYYQQNQNRSWAAY